MINCRSSDRLSNRITKAFNKSMAIRAVTFGIFKVFDRVWHAALHHKLKSYVISGHAFGLVSSFFNLYTPSSHSGREVFTRLNLGVPKGHILGSILVFYINNFSGGVICNIAML